MAYQPSPSDVARTIGLLMTAFTPDGSGKDKAALQEIDVMKQHPQFFACLAYVLANERDPRHEIARQQCGIMIKNNILRPDVAQLPAVQQYVVQALADPSEKIRRPAATAVSQAVMAGNWPVDIVDFVVGLLRGDENSQAGSLTAICDLCEDAVPLLGSVGKTPLLVGAVIPYALSGNPIFRKKAIHALSVLLEEAGLDISSATYAALKPNIPTVVRSAIDLTNAETDETTVCYAIRSLIFSVAFPNELGPFFGEVVQLMGAKSTQGAEGVRKVAIEFWRGILYVPQFAHQVVSLLPVLVQVLVTCMIYTPTELSMMSDGANDYMVEDRESDIKPQKYSVRHKAIGDEADHDEDEEEVLEDSLRANAGLTLDKCAEYYGDALLNHVLTVVSEFIQSSDWLRIEAAVMAVGAIADGCYAGMRPHLQGFLLRVLQLLEDDRGHFLVHVICCWTLSQYSPWFGEDDGQGPQYLPRAVDVILRRMVSPSKRLQYAASACLSVFASELKANELAPFAPKIMKTVHDCFGGYKLKNRYLLFETVDSLCCHLQRRLAHDDCIQLLLTPLLSLWGQTPDNSPMLYPYFVCMSGVCSALGDAVTNFAPQIFSRAFQLAAYHAQSRAALRTNPLAEVPEDEFLVSALDLLGGLSEALQGGIATLIEPIADQYTQMIGLCLSDVSSAVRQGVFAIIGDLCTASTLFVQRLLPHLQQPLLDGLADPINRTGEACNVGWILHDLACNQIEIQGVPMLGQAHIDMYYSALVNAITAKRTSDMMNMAQNAALALGRFLFIDPSALQRHAQHAPIAVWLHDWLYLMHHVRSSYAGKEPAVRAMLLAIASNPAAVVPHMNDLFDLAVSFSQPSTQLHKEFADLFAFLKQGLGAQFQTAVGGYNRTKYSKLRTQYAL